MARMRLLPGALCKRGPCKCARTASAVDGLLAVCQACAVYMPLENSAVRCAAKPSLAHWHRSARLAALEARVLTGAARANNAML